MARAFPPCYRGRMGTPNITRTRQRGRDRSLVLASADWHETPDFVNTAIALGHFVSCGKCARVIGVGIDRISAERAALNSNLGICNDQGWFCEEHANDEEKANV